MSDPLDNLIASVQHRRLATWRAAVKDGGIAFAITTFALYLPVVYYYFFSPAFIGATGDGEFLILPAIGPLIIAEAFLFHIPKADFGRVLLILYSITFPIGCCAAMFCALRRSWWWTVSVTAMLFGLSFMGCFVLHGLWAM